MVAPQPKVNVQAAEPKSSESANPKSRKTGIRATSSGPYLLWITRYQPLVIQGKNTTGRLNILDYCSRGPRHEGCVEALTVSISKDIVRRLRDISSLKVRKRQ